MQTMTAAIVLLFVATPLVGCDSGESTDEGSSSTGSSHAAPAGPSAADTAEATKIFQTRCTPCHGALGHGDGPTSKGLTPQPRNLSDGTWQSKVDDAYLERVIQLGGAAVGKSPAMPPNPDLADKPNILKALRAKVRSLRQ